MPPHAADLAVSIPCAYSFNNVTRQGQGNGLGGCHETALYFLPILWEDSATLDTVWQLLWLRKRSFRKYVHADKVSSQDIRAYVV